MIALAIDASTYSGTVCVAHGRDILAARTVAMRHPAGERLMPAVAATLADAGLTVERLDRVVCGSGPGSFTSLRIAAAIAKGLVSAAAKPLYTVSSLVLMVAAAEPPVPPGEYLAVLDALRGEAYVGTCVVDASGDVSDAGAVTLMTAGDLAAAERGGTTTVGEDRRIRSLPHACGVVRASALVDRGGPADVAAWEPQYGRVAEAQRRWEAAHGRVLPHA